MLYLAGNLLNLSIVSRCYKFKVGYCCLMLMFTSLVFIVEVSFRLGSEFFESCESLFSDFCLIYDVVLLASLCRRLLVFVLNRVIQFCDSCRVHMFFLLKK
ncbi:hypothetical protein HanPSC8_Chr03g0121861 [Helianthus annuus]|nr:hypothetical protein HanPSC8_Chr03g0121861 [Helianthus annuus]